MREGRFRTLHKVAFYYSLVTHALGSLRGSLLNKPRYQYMHITRTFLLHKTHNTDL